MSSPADSRLSRRRAHEARGISSSQSVKAHGADRLPPAPRERRPALALLAVLLIVGGALLAGLLAMRLDQRSEMLIVSRTVAAGQQITRDDLASASVAAQSESLIPASEAEQVVGQVARVEVSAGEFLQRTQITADSPLGDDAAAVGLSLETGRFPAGGVVPGDVVDIVNISDGSVAVSGAQVLEADPSSGTAGDWTSGATVSVLVPRTSAATTAMLGAGGSVAIIVTAAGQPIGEG